MFVRHTVANTDDNSIDFTAFGDIFGSGIS